jgi:hypothetical protein
VLSQTSGQRARALGQSADGPHRSRPSPRRDFEPSGKENLQRTLCAATVSHRPPPPSFRQAPGPVTGNRQPTKFPRARSRAALKPQARAPSPRQQRRLFDGQVLLFWVSGSDIALSSRAGGRVGKRGTAEAPLESRFSTETRGRSAPKIVSLFGAREVPRVPVPHPLGTTGLCGYRSKRERTRARERERQPPLPPLPLLRTGNRQPATGYHSSLIILTSLFTLHSSLFTLHSSLRNFLSTAPD